MSGCCNEDQEIVSVKGPKGDTGSNGWTPLLAVVSDGTRRVLQIIGWTGGTGNTPAYTNQYIGAASIVSDIDDAVDIRGATGTTGATGVGEDGWTAVIANVADGSRIVQQILDWVGGGGTKPSVINQYIGSAGIVNTAAAATDIRGATGATGADGAAGVDATDGRSKITSNDTTLGYLKDKLISSDSTVSFTEVNDAGNEDLSLSTKSVASDQYSIVTQGLTTSFADVFTYTTPNDGFTRKYKIDFNCKGNMEENDGTGRSSAIHVALFIDGSEIKQLAYDIFSKANTSRSENTFALTYAGAILPNKVIAIKAKKSSDNPGVNSVRVDFKSLSIFGIL